MPRPYASRSVTSAADRHNTPAPTDAQAKRHFAAGHLTDHMMEVMTRTKGEVDFDGFIRERSTCLLRVTRNPALVVASTYAAALSGRSNCPHEASPRSLIEFAVKLYRGSQAATSGCDPTC